MKLLLSQAISEIQTFLDAAKEQALQSGCLRSKCGAVIVRNGAIIGRGFNSAPGGLQTQQRCLRKAEIKDGFKSDRTCCIHAEQRAIMDALKHHLAEIDGSDMYFYRLNDDGIIEATVPYCTICSKMTLDAGVATMLLYQAEGYCLYEAAEYNNASFAYPQAVS